MKRLAILPLVAFVFACSETQPLGPTDAQFHHNPDHNPGGSGSAHFHSTSASIVLTGPNQGALLLEWDQRGVGSNDITYDFSADFEATFACFNRGGKNPSATNKQSVEGGAEGSVTVEPKNGRVQGSVLLGPPSPGDFSCPSGQVMRFADVRWFNISLEDTTNEVTADFDPDEVFHQFFAI